jgi:hypothetical protein
VLSRAWLDWWWWNPVYQPSASSCYAYCAQNGANACEWHVSGDCYVEFSTGGCYVQPGGPRCSERRTDRVVSPALVSQLPQALAEQLRDTFSALRQRGLASYNPSLSAAGGALPYGAATRPGVQGDGVHQYPSADRDTVILAIAR